MAEPKLSAPVGGAKITISNGNGKLSVPNNPIIPFIEGDGTGLDIWRASVRVLDAAVAKAYGGKRKIHRVEAFAGQKAWDNYNTWPPDATVEACREYLVSIKGPLTTPIGGGIRSLNVALRQLLDLYVCLRPVRWFKGVPSPVKKPEEVDMVIFRENTEDIYAGIEFEAGTEANKKFLELFKANFPKEYAKIRFPGTLWHRHQGHFSGRYRAAVPRDDPVRDCQQEQEHHDRAQGQHHEVHRRRLPQLELCGCRTRIRQQGLHPWTMERTKADKGEKAANEEQKAAALAKGATLHQGRHR